MRRLIPLGAMALALSTISAAAELVPLPSFNAVDLRGGGEVHVVPAPTQSVAIVQGSDAITRIYVDRDGSLKIDTCRERCPSAYHLSVEVRSPEVLPLAVDGGGVINVAGGFAPQRHLATLVNGGGRIDARAVSAADVSAAINGGGELLVHADMRLSGAVRGGGVVRYWGNPRMKSSAIEGGGSIRPGD